jgi:predicted DNA-binding transcriptional regulator YafY
MRADRLVAALLVLQARGRVTAAQLAEELEVSERTARRDLEALAMAGVPVYSQAGRGGGWSLIGGARTDLSGLTGAEARALFLLAGPSAQATPPVKAALRKLVRALPETMRAEAEAAASAVMIDAESWDYARTPPPEHLEGLQQAVVDAVRIELAYAGPGRDATARVVSPLGLVRKGPLWYLVANTRPGLRTYRVDRVRGVTPTSEPADRPDGFDLAEHWKTVVAELDERRAPLLVKVRVRPHAIGWLRGVAGKRMALGDETPDGWVEAKVRMYAPEQAASELAGFGGALEIIEPDEVRTHLARIGEELMGRYRPR